MNPYRIFLLLFCTSTFAGSFWLGEEKLFNYLYILFVIVGLITVAYCSRTSPLELLGFKAIESKMMFNAEPANHSSFLIWIIAIYVALFGLASGRYENNLDRIEIKTTIFDTYIASGNTKIGIEMIPSLQKEKMPIKPEFHLPLKTMLSFFSDRQKYQDVIDKAKERLEKVIKNNPNALKGLDLTGADLSSITIAGAHSKLLNLTNSKLHGVDFSNSTLKHIDFAFAKIDVNTTFAGATLEHNSMKILPNFASEFTVPEFAENLCKAKKIRSNCNQVHAKLRNYLTNKCNQVFQCKDL